MSDDALPPDSLVGRLLNPLKDETGSGDVIFVAEPEPLPLWRVMEEATGSCLNWEPLIEALRDWQLPEEPVHPFDGRNASNDEWLDRGALRQRQRLRAQLTAQARIARGDSNG